MIRLLIFLLILLFLPLFLFLMVMLVITLKALVKFGIIKSAFSFKDLSDRAFKADTAQSQDSASSKSFFKKFTCKHHNLEQKEAILICSDCGEIIQNED